MANKRKKKAKNDFEELDNDFSFIDEEESSEDISEEINLDNPNFDGEIWENYAEDLDFEE